MTYADAGNVLHKTLQNYYDGRFKNLQETKDFFTLQWKLKKLDQSKIAMKKDEYWLMCVRGVNLGKHLTSTELRLFYDDVVGYFDGVNTQEDEILDWKSSTRRKENEEEYKQQLMFYAYLYNRKFGRIPSKVVVYYLKYDGSNGELSFEPTEEDIKQAEKWHLEAREQMSQLIEKGEVPPVTEGCFTFCPFENICAVEGMANLKFTLHIQGNNIVVDGPITNIIHKALEKKFSYELQNAHWIKKARPNANTMVKFWNGTQRKLPIGFLHGLKKTLSDYAAFKKLGLELEEKDYRTFDNIKITMPEKFLNDIVLRDYQTTAVDVFLKNKIGILEIGTGGGKCFGKETKILMYDLSVKNVEDIKVGDKLMGDDGTPRKVLSFARGKEQMYKIKQKLSCEYIVNESHILSIKKSRNNHCNYLPEKVDIELSKYINWSDAKKKGFGGYKNCIDFSDKPIKIDPYFLGLWLGDGGTKVPYISNKDKEVINFLKLYAKKLNMKLSDYNYDGKMGSYAITNGMNGGKKNILLDWMREYNLLGDKHIPFDYLRNTKKIRLQLLAGLIDSDGWVSGKNKKGRAVQITQKKKKLAKDILLLCNSLGYFTRWKKIKKYYKVLGKEGIYYQITVRGNLSEIPTKIKRKKLYDAFYPKRYESTKLNIEKLNVDNYYGFEIDGNKRFLLEDFTVVHNTEIAIEIIRRLGVKTLFIVDKIELLRQAKQRIEKSLGITVGQIGHNVVDIQMVTVATIQTLVKHISKFAPYLRDVRFCIFDETHKVAAKSYWRISQQLINSEYRLGLCLHFHTKILDNNGHTKIIKDIKIGDKVLSYNHNTNKIEEDIVSNVFQKEVNQCYKLYVKKRNGTLRQIKCSGEHRFFANNEYKKAKDLQIGDKVKVFINAHGVLDNNSKKVNIRKKISKRLKGRQFSIAHCENLSKSHKGQPAWNKNKTKKDFPQLSSHRKGLSIIEEYGKEKGEKLRTKNSYKQKLVYNDSNRKKEIIYKRHKSLAKHIKNPWLTYNRQKLIKKQTNDKGQIICQNCNKPMVGRKRLHCHHKNKNRNNHSLDELMIVCARCHKHLDGYKKDGKGRFSK